MIERRPAWLSLSTWCFAILLAVVSIGPAAWLLAIALQPPGTDLREIGLAATLDNFAAAWKDGSLAGPLVNSVLVKQTRENVLKDPSAITYAIPVRFLHPLLAQP